MTALHRITGLLLAALIALTAQSAAVARTMPDAAGQMVLCTGTGPVMVYFDADGTPTAAPHLCPDAALSLVLALAAPALSLAPGGAWEQVLHAAPVQASIALQFVLPQARAPPAVV